jgi:hypothetical protein
LSEAKNNPGGLYESVLGSETAIQAGPRWSVDFPNKKQLVMS